MPTPPRTPSLLEVAGHIPAPEINQYVPPNLFDLLGIKTTYTTTGPSAAVTAAQSAGEGFDPIGFVVQHPWVTFGVGATLILLLTSGGRRR